MDLITHFFSIAIDFALHIDQKLPMIFNDYGLFTYLFIFLVIFCETGLVIFPILPGDSLIFAIGAVAKTATLNLWFVYALLLVAAIGGNLVNYAIGRTIGQKLLDKSNNKFIKKEYLIKTQGFYEKHGGVAIILSRFMPIIRTFAPFVAGIGKMNFINFFVYNLVGGFLWVSLLLFSGYFFGTIPFVQHNFEYVVIGIVLISLTPAVFTWLKSRSKKK